MSEKGVSGERQDEIQDHTPQEREIGVAGPELSSREKDYITGILCMTVFIQCFIVSQFPPFLTPLILYDFNYGKNVVGCILAIYPACAILAGYWSPWVLNNITKKNILLCSLVMQLLGAFGVGILTYITYDNDLLFLGLAFLFIALLGLGAGFAEAMVYTTISEVYPLEEVPSKLSSVQISFGLGMMMGPSLGAILHSLANFFAAFASGGTISLCLFVLTVMRFPNLPLNTSVRHSHKHTFKFFRSIPAIYGLSAACVVLAITAILMNFVTPLMMQEFDISQNSSALLICIQPFVYTIAYTPFASVVSQSERKWTFISVGILLQVIGLMFFLPPDEHEDYHVISPIFGFTVAAFQMIFISLAVIPTILEDVEDRFPDPPEEVLDGVTAMFVLSQNVGDVIGSILSGFLIDSMDYRGTYTTAAFVGFCFVFTFTVLLWNYKPHTQLGASMSETRSEEDHKPLLDDIDNSNISQK